MSHLTWMTHSLGQQRCLGNFLAGASSQRNCFLVSTFLRACGVPCASMSPDGSRRTFGREGQATVTVVPGAGLSVFPPSRCYRIRQAYEFCGFCGPCGPLAEGGVALQFAAWLCEPTGLCGPRNHRHRQTGPPTASAVELCESSRRMLRGPRRSRSRHWVTNSLRSALPRRTVARGNKAATAHRQQTT